MCETRGSYFCSLSHGAPCRNCTVSSSLLGGIKNASKALVLRETAQNKATTSNKLSVGGSLKKKQKKPGFSSFFLPFGHKRVKVRKAMRVLFHLVVHFEKQKPDHPGVFNKNFQKS